MDIWKKIRRISFFKLIQFGWIFLQKPRLIFPVWNATKETLKICKETIQSIKAQGPKDIGKVMVEIKKKYADVLDFSKVSLLVKEILK